jgi:cytidylate kinase
MTALGRPFSESDVRQRILRRDAIDSQREDSPLRAAEDAIVVGTDGLNQEQVVEKIVALVEGKS